MSKIKLYDYQLEALDRMRNGCILCGGVGSGKSRTALGYYYLRSGGDRRSLAEEKAPYIFMKKPRDLYIITTARKRDTGEWEDEMAPFLLASAPIGKDIPDERMYRITVKVDSWNNIKKYKDIRDAFFIFDEQRVVGWGAWSKTFVRIARQNEWILLSATPGDSWSDYIPVFVANGFYKNKSDFSARHIVYGYHANAKYPVILRYVDEGHLQKLRYSILVDMGFERKTVAHHEDIWCSYDLFSYKSLFRNRWDCWENKPIENASELCYALRKVVNSDRDRGYQAVQLAQSHPRAIVFYNFDYELDILRELPWPMGTVVAEWNGHKHEQVPNTEQWVYLVQYTAGAEGWNCVRTDTMIFWSQNYSYKIMVQAAGRIDRLNTPYTELYYYHLKSRSGIDLAIAKALRNKKNFNERMFAK